MASFLDMIARIARELRRPNVEVAIKDGINDAIFEASSNRLYFNEMVGYSFPTVNGQEYYDDLGVTEVDAIYYLVGGGRFSLKLQNNDDMDKMAEGNVITGPVTDFSRYGTKIRLYPIPSSVVTIYFSGFGRLTPYPLTADTDTNAWLTEGERYIRALAKRNVLRDLIHDHAEATIQEAIAGDALTDLVEKFTQHSATGTLRGTQW